MSQALTQLNKGDKHGYFQSVCCLRMVTLFLLSCKEQLDSCLHSGSGGSWACSSTGKQVSQESGPGFGILDCVHLEARDFVHNSTQILLGLLNVCFQKIK